MASEAASELPGSPSPVSAGPSLDPVSDAWPWDAEPSGAAHAHDDIDADVGEPDGEALGESGSDVPPPDVAAVEPSAEPGWVDPCTLVTDAEWADWTDDGVGTTRLVLEDGDVCGWISGSDDVRLAIGAFLAEGSVRWLRAEEFAAGEPVSELGDRAVWLPNWPIRESSTLVVEAGEFDLVIEMSAQDPSDPAALRSGAVQFAELALGRLP